MLDANEAKLTKIGEVFVSAEGEVQIDGFDGDGCTIRDVAALAIVHAIGVLQRELMAVLEKPGGGNIVVD